MAISRAFLIWLLLMAVETVHGTLRNLLLAPVIGDALARRFGVATGAVLIFLISFATIRWLGVKRTVALLGVGLLWVVLTVAFEVILGRWMLHLDWPRIVSDYDFRHGGLMPLGLVCMLFTPLATARIRKNQAARH
jgi:hypothetical protein